VLTDTCLTINAFFGWEFNSCESLRKNGVFHPIDFANACPDFQVTSLHYHFPELVKNMVRWSLFCAATKRTMPMNLDWKPFYDIAKKDLPYRERLKGYAKIANERMETERFQEFCDKHLSHLDEVALEFFGTEVAKGYVRQKVSALFPAHEVHKFTEHFWGMVQFWRKTESDRLNHVKAAREAAAAAAAPEVIPSAPVEVVEAPETEVEFSPPPAEPELAAAPVVTPPPVVTPTPSKSSQKKANRARN
jgi:hypothetical protein